MAQGRSAPGGGVVQRDAPARIRWLTGAGMALLGLALAAAGGWLALLGGSWYYALAGAGLIACGVLIALGRRAGVWAYGALLSGTAIWALWEAGLDAWGLTPRLFEPMALGAWLLTPWVRGRLDGPIWPGLPSWAPRAGMAAAAAIACAPLIALATAPRPTAPAAPAPASPAGQDWPHYGRDAGGLRHAPLTQIHPGNVASLTVAWRARLGEVGDTLEATPLKIKDTLFLCTARNTVIALDAATGAEKWRHDPEIKLGRVMLSACRGVAYHAAAAEPEEAGACAARILVATMDARLIAVDAQTGTRCAGFGQGGEVSLLEGLGEVSPGQYYVTSPPTVAGGRVIVGAAVFDNLTLDAPSGVIRAFDAQSGALAWAWDMGRPERTGAPAPGETYTRNTPNAWISFAADEALGLVYVPTGNPGGDFWGGSRRPFDEKYGSAVVALEIATGRARWSFQTTRHDLWDYDVPAQPVLVDLRTPEGVKPALVQATKRGEVFVLDRRTGAPIAPVTERPAPLGASEGDWTAPMQPYSAVSVAPKPLTEADMWGMTPIDHLGCRIWFRRLRYEGNFTPPGLKPTLKYPGALGVIDWGGVAVDPERGLVIANTSAIAYVDRLLPRAEAPPFAQSMSAERSYAWGPHEGAPFVSNTQTFTSKLDIPCTAPPWGRLAALNLRTGATLWSISLGTARDSGPRRRALGLPLPMGVPNTGGAITTSSGLVFVAATVDRYLRAFDTGTGRELWRGRLPAAGHATPMTYSTADGRQFVVIAAGGHVSMGPRLGDEIVAFALPAAAQASAKR